MKIKMKRKLKNHKFDDAMSTSIIRLLLRKLNHMNESVPYLLDGDHYSFNGENEQPEQL